MFLNGKFLQLKLSIDSAVGKAAHLQQHIVVFLVLLLKERVDAGKSLGVPTLVVLPASVLDLLIVVKPQSGKDLLRMGVVNKGILL
jgi:hypothetical protein